MDLATNFMGMKLRSPLVPAASPLSKEVDTVLKLEQAGASAVVLHSLFEEQILSDQYQVEKGLSQGIDSFAESLSYFPRYEDILPEPSEYVKHLGKVKKAVKIPVIASLNGMTPGGWTKFAKNLQDAGADALELNLYNVPTEIRTSGSALEDGYVQVLKDVKSVVKIPVAVKLSPFFSSLPNAVQKFAEAGAAGVVLFNRFYQPDFNLETLDVEQSADLSISGEHRLALRWLAILYGRVKVDFAASGGIHTAEDAVKVILAGADVVQLCSALLKNGPEHLRTMEKGISFWMKEHEYDSVKEMVGSASQKKHENPEAFERAQYLQVLHSQKKMAAK
jgi:dihydroorotate dehydrogenase (fumarate)